MGSAQQRGSGHRRGCEWGLHLTEGVDTEEGVNGVCTSEREWTQGKGVNGVCTTDREWIQERV